MELSLFKTKSSFVKKMVNQVDSFMNQLEPIKQAVRQRSMVVTQRSRSLKPDLNSLVRSSSKHQKQKQDKIKLLQSNYSDNEDECVEDVQVKVVPDSARRTPNTQRNRNKRTNQDVLESENKIQ